MSLYHKSNNGIKQQLEALNQKEHVVYKELTEEKIIGLIEDIMCKPPPEGRQIKAWAITPEGLIPIEETKEFHEAMKEHVNKLRDGL